MINQSRIFCNMSRGSMLIELLLSVAIAAVVIPFAFRYQENAVLRAQNIAITRQMSDVQTALERYIVDHREDLLKTVGRNITRVNLKDLAEYGISENIISEGSDNYQLRVLKSSDTAGQATLQGVVVFSADEISPMRTREIVAIGGDRMGFIEGKHAYGTFGAWHADTIDLGVNLTDGIVGTTGVSRDNALYLWRIPSENMSDATMMSALNLGGHNITNATFVNSIAANFDEIMNIGVSVADNVIFDTRPTIDRQFAAQNATVAGGMSSDSKNMEVAGTFSLADLGKFSSFAVADLWTSNLTLSGLSIANAASNPATIKVNQALDMTGGRITAMYVTVGFAGSITPRLVVRDRIEDSIDSNYFWDATLRIANFSDVTLAELGRMAPLIVHDEQAARTDGGKIFAAVAANKNATASDYMNAIAEIQKLVRAKYRRLNLE